MTSILGQLDTAFRSAIRQAFGEEADPILTPSQNEKFGDYQSNAAMGLAKAQKANPRQVAEKIKAALNLGDMASEVSIAGPGFINVRLSPIWLASLLQQAGSDPRLGIESVTKPETVVVDYSGPNIAKEMHVGHLRSTIIGDAISRVIEFQGHKVVRQNHIGDWGTQFGMLIAYLLTPAGTTEMALSAERIDELIQHGSRDIDLAVLSDLEGFYRQAKKRFDEDPVFQNLSRFLVVQLQSKTPEVLAAWKTIVDESRKHFVDVYKRLKVALTPDDERGESAYNSNLSNVVQDLKSKGLAVESEGAVAVFVDGPDKTPLIIQKTDGGYLYGTTDLAAIRYRVTELHADRIIYTHDSRQAQHFSQVFRTADKASWTRHGEVKLEYAPFGTMLGEDGKPFKTRSGEIVKLKELLDEAEERALKLVTEKNPTLPEQQRQGIARAVGIGAVKYADLSKDRISDYVFSWEKMLSFDGNTAPYLQNAYVRVHGIFRKAKASGLDINVNHRAIRLESPFELAIAKQILRLGEVIELVSRELKPHFLTTYLYELATKYHAFFENCPVLQSEEPTRSSRLALSDLTARTMALGLDLLGIEHPEQM